MRVIARETDVGAAANVGGPVSVSFKTWRIECEEIELWLKGRAQFCYREVIGFEIEQDTETKAAKVQP